MSRQVWNRPARVCLAVAMVLPMASCAVGVGSEGTRVRDEKRFTVTGTPDVTLATFDGAVEVRAWDRQEVVVEIEKHGATQAAVDAIEVVTEQSGQQVRIEARRPSRRDAFFGLGLSSSVKLVASVPRAANLFVRTGDGTIAVEQVSGRIELRSGDGNVRAVDVDGDVSVRTGDGSVKLESVRGRVDLTTGDGGISVDGTLAAVKLRTGDGSILLRVAEGSTIAEPWDVSTGDGGVVIYLPRDFNTDLDASTDDGVIRSEIGGQMDGPRDRRRMHGRLGAGGPPLRVRTGDGSISLRAS